MSTADYTMTELWRRVVGWGVGGVGQEAGLGLSATLYICQLTLRQLVKVAFIDAEFVVHIPAPGVWKEHRALLVLLAACEPAAGLLLPH
jgi:hypothetical protein